MGKSNEALKTLVVSTGLCMICSVLVSATVVLLKPKQIKNKELDVKKNILMSAGLADEKTDIEEAFKTVETKILDFETGRFVETINHKTFDQNKAAADPNQSVKIPSEIDFGGLSRRSKYAKVFITRDSEGKVDTIVLNVVGKGLWSTMYGFIALASDTTTIKGFAYYAQAETPGLGGEVDNPNWKKQWIGKKVYDENYEIAFGLSKGTLDHTHGLAQYKVDALSGATITSNGVTGSMKYWFGDHAYGKFLANVRAGEI